MQKFGSDATFQKTLHLADQKANQHLRKGCIRSDPSDLF